MRSSPISSLTLVCAVLSFLPLGCASTSMLPTRTTTVSSRERVESARIHLSPAAWPLPHLPDDLSKGAIQLGGTLAIPTKSTDRLEGRNDQVVLPASLAGSFDATIWASPWLGWTLSARATEEGFADARFGAIATTRPDRVRFSSRLGGGILAMSGTNILVQESRIDDQSWEETSRREASPQKLNPYLSVGVSAQPGGAMGPWLDIQGQTPVTWAHWSKATTTTTTTYKVTREDCSRGAPWIFGQCPTVEYDSVVVEDSESAIDPGKASVAFGSVAAGWVARTGRIQWTIGMRRHFGVDRTTLELQASLLARSPRKAP